MAPWSFCSIPQKAVQVNEVNLFLHLVQGLHADFRFLTEMFTVLGNVRRESIHILRANSRSYQIAVFGKAVVLEYVGKKNFEETLGIISSANIDFRVS